MPNIIEEYVSEKKISKPFNNPKLSPYHIDQEIINKIQQATSENSEIWTSPDFNRREYIHSFFQYPAMMVPVVQKKLVDIILSVKPEIKTMLDPFMGSATTLVTSMENGLDCHGQDINPLAILIGKVRTGPFYIDQIISKSQILLKSLKKDTEIGMSPFFKGISKWFKEDTIQELTRLVKAIKQEKNIDVRRFYWVVLAETIRLCSNDRTSTFKLHIRKKEDLIKRKLSAISVFEQHLKNSILDFESYAKSLERNNKLYKGKYIGNIDIRLANSQSRIHPPRSEKYYDLLVTSPPYGDNKTTVTYGQHSYLPLQWIDLDDIDTDATDDFIRTTSEIDTRSLGGRLSKIDYNKIQLLFINSPTAKKTFEIVKTKDANRIKKIAAFLIDLNDTLNNIFKVMKTNSYQIWTIGNRRVADIEIPNHVILTELIESKGGILVTKLERNIINKRMAFRNSNTKLMCKEDILIFRKVG